MSDSESMGADMQSIMVSLFQALGDAWATILSCDAEVSSADGDTVDAESAFSFDPGAYVLAMAASRSAAVSLADPLVERAVEWRTEFARGDASAPLPAYNGRSWCLLP